MRCGYAGGCAKMAGEIDILFGIKTTGVPNFPIRQSE